MINKYNEDNGWSVGGISIIPGRDLELEDKGSKSSNDLYTKESMELKAYDITPDMLKEIHHLQNRVEKRPTDYAIKVRKEKSQEQNIASTSYDNRGIRD